MSTTSRMPLLAATLLIALPVYATAATNTPTTEVTVSLKPYGAPEPTTTPVRQAAAANATQFKLRVQPLAELRLNDTTGLHFKNGASLGTDQSGASGKTGDKSYSIDTASNPSALCFIPGPTDTVTADELSVTAWYKPRSLSQRDVCNLFNGFASSLFWDTKGNQWIWRIASKDPSNPKSLICYGSGSSPDLLSPGKWTFIAMVWKRGENTARFYLGPPGKAPVESHTATLKGTIDPAIEPHPSRTLGNDERKPDRCFNGEIDDVRFFTKALDPADIATIYKADLQNMPVAAP